MKLNRNYTDISLSFKTWQNRSNPPRVFLAKSVLKIRIKFTGEHPCRSVILINLFCNFTEIILRHGCSPINLLYIFRTPFPKNTSERLLLAEMILHQNCASSIKGQFCVIGIQSFMQVCNHEQKKNFWKTQLQAKRRRKFFCYVL